MDHRMFGHFQIPIIPTSIVAGAAGSTAGRIDETMTASPVHIAPSKLQSQLTPPASFPLPNTIDDSNIGKLRPGTLAPSSSDNDIEMSDVPVSASSTSQPVISKPPVFTHYVGPPTSINKPIDPAKNNNALPLPAAPMQALNNSSLQAVPPSITAFVNPDAPQTIIPTTPPSQLAATQPPSSPEILRQELVNEMLLHVKPFLSGNQLRPDADLVCFARVLAMMPMPLQRILVVKILAALTPSDLHRIVASRDMLAQMFVYFSDACTEVLRASNGNNSCGADPNAHETIIRTNTLLIRLMLELLGKLPFTVDRLIEFRFGLWTRKLARSCGGAEGGAPSPRQLDESIRSAALALMEKWTLLAKGVVASSASRSPSPQSPPTEPAHGQSFSHITVNVIKQTPPPSHHTAEVKSEAEGKERESLDMQVDPAASLQPPIASPEDAPKAEELQTTSTETKRPSDRKKGREEAHQHHPSGVCIPPKVLSPRTTTGASSTAPHPGASDARKPKSSTEKKERKQVNGVGVQAQPALDAVPLRKRQPPPPLNQHPQSEHPRRSTNDSNSFFSLDSVLSGIAAVPSPSLPPASSNGRRASYEESPSLPSPSTSSASSSCITFTSPHGLPSHTTSCNGTGSNRSSLDNGDVPNKDVLRAGLQDSCPNDLADDYIPPDDLSIIPETHHRPRSNSLTTSTASSHSSSQSLGRARKRPPSQTSGGGDAGRKRVSFPEDPLKLVQVRFIEKRKDPQQSSSVWGEGHEFAHAANVADDDDGIDYRIDEDGDGCDEGGGKSPGHADASEARIAFERLRGEMVPALPWYKPAKASAHNHEEPISSDALFRTGIPPVITAREEGGDPALGSILGAPVIPTGDLTTALLKPLYSPSRLHQQHPAPTPLSPNQHPGQLGPPPNTRILCKFYIPGKPESCYWRESCKFVHLDDPSLVPNAHFYQQQQHHGMIPPPPPPPIFHHHQMYPPPPPPPPYPQAHHLHPREGKTPSMQAPSSHPSRPPFFKRKRGSPGLNQKINRQQTR